MFVIDKRQRIRLIKIYYRVASLIIIRYPILADLREPTLVDTGGISSNNNYYTFSSHGPNSTFPLGSQVSQNRMPEEEDILFYHNVDAGADCQSSLASNLSFCRSRYISMKA